MKLLVLVDIGDDLIVPTWMPTGAVQVVIPDDPPGDLDVLHARLHDAANAIFDYLMSQPSASSASSPGKGNA